MESRSIERRLEISPALAEITVLTLKEAPNGTGPSKQDREYHIFADLLYKQPEQVRSASFDKLHLYFFNRWGCLQVLQEALQEGFQFGAGVARVAVKKSENDEGCYLGQDRQSLLISIRPDRFLDPPALKKYLRFELLHLADIMDPNFGYRYEDKLDRKTGVPETLIRERYRTLWDACIDARLVRRGQEPFYTRENHDRAVVAMVPHLVPEQSRRLFAALWERDSITHEELLRWAIDPTQFQKSLDPDHAAPVAPLPGGRCPLCYFPSFSWKTPDTASGQTMIERIRNDFPRWLPEQGLCERCFEFYELRAPVESVMNARCRHPFEE